MDKNLSTTEECQNVVMLIKNICTPPGNPSPQVQGQTIALGLPHTEVLDLKKLTSLIPSMRPQISMVQVFKMSWQISYT